uniref:Protein kinase domain-containing protein n=1 Tax=Nelumbo nucifera TaxID=4432 RepID=A0A822Z5A4_NELNU|nr:TPA_asm: hypothetical protein HUJ06_014093 [Nelumbo nucifera]
MGWKIIVVSVILFLNAASTSSQSLAKPGCQEKCGELSIPYPFGVGNDDSDCFRDSHFHLVCNTSSGHPVLHFEGGNIPFLNISLEGQSTVYIWITIDCYNQSGRTYDGFQEIDITLGNILSFSSTRNKFTAIGCDTKAYMSSSLLSGDSFTSGCISFCTSDETLINGSCSGIGCCQTSIPNGLHTFNVSLSSFYNHTYSLDFNPCSYAFLADQDWFNNNFNFSSPDLMDLPKKRLLFRIGSSLALLLSFFASFWLYQLYKRIRSKKIKEKFFKQNGGLLLQQQISLEEGNFDNTKIFHGEELEKATDRYNVNRILGQGGQGTVYKGILTDGRIVAIKKSKKVEMVDEVQIKQFINELVVLSKINHRNVVKLLGCCLETEVPLLVYEFISSGTLFNHIHDRSDDDMPFTWDNRLRIATEVVGALSYLHSAASIPIYHRDVKSSNILLDDKYRAKVSDFGTSRPIAVDKTHLTTAVQGTLGYLDPQYFQSSQFTEKSDVYSFGVVLVELLTGEKPISSFRPGENKSLATYFLSSMEENRLFEILDAQVVKKGEKAEIEVVSNLAKRCLDLNGKNRPTMKEVTVELEGLRISKAHTLVQENHQEVDYCLINRPTCLQDSGSTSIGYKNLEKKAKPLDDQPLLCNPY